MHNFMEIPLTEPKQRWQVQRGKIFFRWYPSCRKIFPSLSELSIDCFSVNAVTWLLQTQHILRTQLMNHLVEKIMRKSLIFCVQRRKLSIIHDRHICRICRKWKIFLGNWLQLLNYHILTTFFSSKRLINENLLFVSTFFAVLIKMKILLLL